MFETDCDGPNATFLRRLAVEVPELDAVMGSHLALHGELLSHLLMADIQRWADATAISSDTGETSVFSKALDLLDVGWIEGGPCVHEMIGDSFMENLTLGGQLWSALPKDLRTAAQSIHESRPKQ